MVKNRRFYYLKLEEGFYNSETMVVQESMLDGLLYSKSAAENVSHVTEKRRNPHAE